MASRSRDEWIERSSAYSSSWRTANKTKHGLSNSVRRNTSFRCRQRTDIDERSNLIPLDNVCPPLPRNLYRRFENGKGQTWTRGLYLTLSTKFVLHPSRNQNRNKSITKNIYNMSTKIEWTTETWNPVTGCTQLSAGCANCNAKTVALQMQKNGVKQKQQKGRFYRK